MGIPKPEVALSARRLHFAAAMEAAKRDYRAHRGTDGRHRTCATRRRGSIANNQHITGTMSMGNDPKDSVVDAFGRTHDHENLFVASTGVMPTAATCNSTLTAVALALAHRGAHRADIGACRPSEHDSDDRLASQQTSCCPRGSVRRGDGDLGQPAGSDGRTRSKPVQPRLRMLP